MGDTDLAMTDELTVLVLAAGKGTRMKSRLPKVMHPLAGRPLIAHVLATAAAIGAARAVVVLAEGMDDVAAEAARAPLSTATVIQEPQHGTGHAVQVASSALPRTGTVLVLYGDTPLMSASTLRALLDARSRAHAAVAVLGMRPPDTTGYGRLRFDLEGLAAIVEARHADETLLREGICNSGVMAIDAARLAALVDGLELHPQKQEYYLTDIVAHARDRGWPCTAIEGPWQDGVGINAKDQLAAAEAIMQARLRARALEDGVTLIAPETVHLAADTVLGPEVEIGPYVVFGPGVVVETGAHVLSFSHLEGVRVGPGARIGPFARLRPGSEIGAGARVGNFVELKSAVLGEGAKVSHLSYVGDAQVGARANVGAGTITCNYDGYGKYETVIGEGAFIGSNSALVAPISVGAGAIVGAGTTVTADVPADALALARLEQTVVEGAAARFRARRAGEKAAAKPAGDDARDGETGAKGGGEG